MSRAGLQAVGVVLAAALLLATALARVGPPGAADRAAPRHPAPRVLVVGSSVAESHVDEATLARAYDVPVEEAVMLWAPRTSILHWSIMVEQELRRRGERLRAIWLPASVGQLLQREVTDVVGRDALLSLADDETPPRFLEPLRPELRALLPVLRLRANVGMWRMDLIDDLASIGPLGLLACCPSAAKQVRDARLAVYDMARFDPELLASSLHDQEFVRFDGIVHPQTDRLERLLAELTTLADEVVVVRVPFSPSNRRTDRYPSAVVQQTADAVARAGAIWIDASDVPLTEGDFIDAFHLSAEAAPGFTEAVLRRRAQR